jgi:uncharacterized membrane protein YeaQ/YmgE (transglycosylase-associated protein family)
MHLLSIVIVGFAAGCIAKLLLPSPLNLQGFVTTIVIGIAGSIVASYLGQVLHLYRAGEDAGIIAAIIGAAIVLAIWDAVERRRM